MLLYQQLNKKLLNKWEVVQNFEVYKYYKVISK